MLTKGYLLLNIENMDVMIQNQGVKRGGAYETPAGGFKIYTLPPKNALWLKKDTCQRARNYYI